MEFIDEDTRPRFLFQSRSSDSSPLPETQKISKIHAVTCIFSSATFFFTAFLFSSNSILFSLLIWISLSLILAPFAPHHITGGDPHVGQGDPLPPLLPKASDLDEPRRRPASRWNSKPSAPSSAPPGFLISKPDEKRGVNSGENSGESMMKEANRRDEWTNEDFEILKRQILKHPVGAPGRWERVAEAFKGRHGVESVIHAAKSLAERRPGDDDFAQFLKQRKPLEKQVDSVNADCSVTRSLEWSSGEDIALLNALKAFPKDAAMRWEKVAAAVPGKSKAECMKRVAELKRDFRSLKTS